MRNFKIILTVGLCARNSEKTISFAIESILNQNIAHDLIEIIFVDDGSTDSTLKIMQSFLKKTDIKIRIFTGAWQGLGKARNTVIFNALGEFILWVDSDEVLTANYARNQIAIMNANPKSGIGIGQLGILPKQSAVLVLELAPYILACYNNSWQYPHKMPGTGASICRLSAAKEVGGFDEEIKGTGEDVDFAIRLVQAGWSLEQGNAIFYETHGEMKTLSHLWNKYVNNGYHGRIFYSKTKFISLFRFNPLSSFIAGLLCSIPALKVINRKITLLLPFHFFLKMTAWLYGFSNFNKIHKNKIKLNGN